MELNLEELRENEIEQIYFGLSSTELLFSINELIKYKVKCVYKTIQERSIQRESAEKHSETEEMMKTQLAQNCNEIDKIINESKLKLKALLHVPKEMIQEHPSFCGTTYTPEDIRRIKEDHEKLLTEYRKSRLFYKLCKEKLKCLEKIQPISQQILQQAQEVQLKADSMNIVKTGEAIDKLFREQPVNPNMSQLFEIEQKERVE